MGAGGKVVIQSLYNHHCFGEQYGYHTKFTQIVSMVSSLLRVSPLELVIELRTRLSNMGAPKASMELSGNSIPALREQFCTVNKAATKKSPSNLCLNFT